MMTSTDLQEAWDIADLFENGNPSAGVSVAVAPTQKGEAIMPHAETEPYIVADVCLTLEADQTVRAILEPGDLEYAEDGVRLGTFRLHTALKLKCGVSVFLRGTLYVADGAAALRDVFVDLDQLGEHPAKLSAEAHRLLVSGMFVAKERGGYTPLAKHPDFVRVLEKSKETK